jgi:hypothetical protein
VPSSEARGRRRHLKAEQGVSAEAHQIIKAAFEDGRPTYETIADEVLKTTGEKVGKSSLGLYYREWNVNRMAREARDIALRQLEGLRRLPPEQLDEVLEQLLRTSAYESLAQAAPGQVDPGKAIRALEARERRRLAERDLAYRERLLTQRGQTTLELALEFWQAMVELVHAADPGAGQALAAVSDKVIDGLKAKYA